MFHVCSDGCLSRKLTAMASGGMESGESTRVQTTNSHSATHALKCIFLILLADCCWRRHQYIHRHIYGLELSLFHFASTAAEVSADTGDEMLAVNEQDVKNFHISDFVG